MKITVSGVVGAGKSTVSREVASRLEIPYMRIGTLQEDIANRRGVTFYELSKIARTDKTVDEEIDRVQAEMNADDSSFVMDSRLGFYVIPNSFKVYLKVDMEEAAARIFSDNRSRQEYSSYKECLEYQIKRVDDEVVRYRNKGVELQDESQFDLVIDTTYLPSSEVAERILDNFR